MRAATGVRQQFIPGATVEASGIYRAVHAKSSKCAGEELVLIKGNIFPKCPGCGEKVRFELERSAPSLGEDQDFRGYS